MVEFWLDNPSELLNVDNFNFNEQSVSYKYIKYLNTLAILSIIIGITMVYIKKDPKYFSITVLVLSLTIFIKSNINSSEFTNVSTEPQQVSYDTGSYLVRSVNGNDPSGLKNLLYVNQASNLNKGDIIVLSNNNSNLETNIISDIKYTTEDNTPVLVLLRDLKGEYSKYTTKILKISQTLPTIVPPPDGNVSIGINKGKSVSENLGPGFETNYNNTKAFNKNDYNLEISSMIPGSNQERPYQGPPYGPLECRKSTPENPMGSINVTEYNSPPTMYGTCNGSLDDNDNLMTTNQEATVSQRVDDLLFHKGNSQMNFTPQPVDTLPSDNEGFAIWLYRSPTNLVNVKYASIFYNDPEKYKLVAKLAKATGTEGGG